MLPVTICNTKQNAEEIYERILNEEKEKLLQEFDDPIYVEDNFSFSFRIDEFKLEINNKIELPPCEEG